MVCTPVLLYVSGTTQGLLELAIGTVFATTLAFVIHGLRFLLGGVTEIVISDEQIQFSKRKKSSSISWVSVASARFEMLNTGPWLELRTVSKVRHSLSLENFEPSALKEITMAVKKRIPKSIRIDKSWTFVARAKVSSGKKKRKIG